MLFIIHYCYILYDTRTYTGHFKSPKLQHNICTKINNVDKTNLVPGPDDLNT